MSKSSNNPNWIGKALAFYAFIAIGIAEAGLGVLLPSIQATYELTPAAIALLFLSQMSGYIVAALGSSLLVSRIGLARMLLLAAASLTGALVIYALSPNWVVMVASGTLLGLGIGLIDAGVNTYIASDQRNANLTGFLHAFYGIGALLGPAVATTLLSLNLNWRIIYLVFAVAVGFVVVGMLWAVISDYAPMNKPMTRSSVDSGASVQAVLTTPTVLVAGLLSLVTVGTEASVGNWAYSVQVKRRDTSALLAGYSISAYWMGMTLGRVGMGWAVRKLGATRTLDYSLVILTAGLVVWWLLPGQLWSLPVIGLGLGAIFPLTVWLMPQRVPEQIVPAAIGFLTSVASLGAAALPTVVGWSADRAGLEIIPTLIIPLAVVMMMLHRWLVQHAPTKSSAAR